MRNDTRASELRGDAFAGVPRTQVLQIPRSSYYATRRNGVRRAVYKEELRRAVQDAFVEHHGSFGRRTLKRVLERKNIRISEYKISKILKELGFRSKYGRKRCKNVYTSKHTEKYIRQNLYASLTEEQKSRMEIWSMDFTEEKINGKKIYTCGIISVSRKILVGYAQDSRCTTALAMEAFFNAVCRGIKSLISSVSHDNCFRNVGAVNHTVKSGTLVKDLATLNNGIYIGIAKQIIHSVNMQQIKVSRPIFRGEV